MIKTEHACYSRCHMHMDVTYSILMLLLYQAEVPASKAMILSEGCLTLALLLSTSRKMQLLTNSKGSPFIRENTTEQKQSHIFTMTWVLHSNNVSVKKTKTKPSGDKLLEFIPTISSCSSISLFNSTLPFTSKTSIFYIVIACYLVAVTFVDEVMENYKQQMQIYWWSQSLLYH